MREHETVETLAESALELCEKHRFPNEAARSRCLLGHACAQLGRAAEGIALISGGIDALVKIGNRIYIPRYMMYLAAAQYRAGAIGNALETVEKALNFNHEVAIERPEALRIRGELSLKQGEVQMGEADFRNAIALSQSMSAKPWELRTTMSLARLLTKQNHREEARTILAEIYDWFTEGFDTADLKDARLLLDELGGAGK